MKIMKIMKIIEMKRKWKWKRKEINEMKIIENNENNRRK